MDAQHTTPGDPDDFKVVGEDPNEFLSDASVGDSYGRGWRVIWASFGVLLAVTLIQTVIEAPMNTPGGDGDDASWLGPFGILALPYGIFLVGPIGMSVSWVFLKAVRKEPFQLEDMFSVFKRNYWNAVGAGILMWLAIVAGLILLVVPGIIIACRLAFVSYLIIDRKMEAIEALRTSWAMTRGHGWTIFAMSLLVIPIVIGGLIALLVGIFIAIMWICAAFAVLYHSVEQKSGVPSLEEPTSTVP